jgi:predicted nucleic acid-binding protein
VEIDIFDTQVWVYAANNSYTAGGESNSYPSAVEMYMEVVDEERAVYVPRYVLAEFYNAMDEMNRSDAHENCVRLHKSLEKSTTAFVPTVEVGAHRPYRNNVSIRRRQPETTALAEALRMQPKDAPIIAVAQRLPEFVRQYDPPNHTDIAIPQEYEEYQLISALKRAGVSDISTRVVTYERDFVGVSALPFSDVSVDRIQDQLED